LVLTLHSQSIHFPPSVSTFHFKLLWDACELFFNIEAAILKVDGFAKESPFTQEELLVLATSFDKAQWEDIFNPGHMGVSVTGSLVFPAKNDESRVWVVEFWHKGGVRLVPATWCAPGIYQIDALGKSSTLDGASGKILRDHGIEMVRSRLTNPPPVR